MVSRQSLIVVSIRIFGENHQLGHWQAFRKLYEGLERKALLRGHAYRDIGAQCIIRLGLGGSPHTRRYRVKMARGWFENRPLFHIFCWNHNVCNVH